MIESAVSEAIKKFLKKQMGEEVKAVSVEVTEDVMIVRLKGVLFPAERLLVKNQQGLELIKALKEKLSEETKPLLKEMIKNLVGVEVIDIHSSFHPATGERIEVFNLSKSLKNKNR